MGADDNIKTIQLFSEAFGRGDIATIVANVTDDVDWGRGGGGCRRDAAPLLPLP